MTTRLAIEAFLGQKTLAIVGVSRRRMKFGNMVFRDLKRKGYRLFPVGRHAKTIDGQRCLPNLAALPEPVGGVFICVRPTETEQVVREAAAAGIRHVWIQQGAGSPVAIRFCEENGLSVVHGHCILMFAEPVGWLHRLHRWLWRLLGKLP